MLENAKRVGRDTDCIAGNITEKEAYRKLRQNPVWERVSPEDIVYGVDTMDSNTSKLTFEAFELIQVHLFSKCIGIAREKGVEYANSSDIRLSNFHRLQDRVGIDAKAVLWIYLTKHLDSLESYIKTGQTYSSESIESRIIDTITYLTLLHGLIIEESGPAAIGKAVLEANEWKASQQKF